MDKTLAALEAIPMHLNLGQVFSLPNEPRQHIATTLKHPNLFADKVSYAILRENGILPLNKMTEATFLGITTSSKGLLQEESNLPTLYISDGFDSDTYKLMDCLLYTSDAADE